MTHLCSVLILAFAVGGCAPSCTISGEWVVAAMNSENNKIMVTQVGKTFTVSIWTDGEGFVTENNLIMRFATGRSLTAYFSKTCDILTWSNGDVWFQPDSPHIHLCKLWHCRSIVSIFYLFMQGYMHTSALYSYFQVAASLYLWTSCTRNT